MKYSAKHYCFSNEKQKLTYLQLNDEVRRRGLAPTFHDWTDTQLHASQLFAILEEAQDPWELMTFHQKFYGAYQNMVHETIKQLISNGVIEILD